MLMATASTAANAKAERPVFTYCIPDKWVDRMPVIMGTWSWLTLTTDWSRAMRVLESVCRKTVARYPFLGPGVVNRLGCASLSAAQNGPAISAS
jgi:hypothetical protein